MNKNDFIIRLETPADFRETESVVREAFWNVYRPGCLEHYLLRVLRTHPDFVPELDFVMERQGRIIGQVIYVRTTLKADDGREIPIMTMGPIGILPEYQRQGRGKALLDFSMEQAAKMRGGALCFEGNIDFYGRSGFVPGSSMGIRYWAESDAPYFLCRELTPGYLRGVTGVYKTPDVYFVDEAQAEAFDRQFPPKEKLRLPGQLSNPNE